MAGIRFIVAGRFIDGSGTPVRRNVFLAVKDTLIAAIGAAADVPRPAGAVVDDLSHCTLVPALVDCSVSLLQSPSVDREVRLSTAGAGSAEKSALLARHSRYCHAHGVLGVADSSAMLDMVKDYQEGRALAAIIDLRSSGPLCRSRQDCLAAKAAGLDFLKVGYSGNIEEPEASWLGLTPEELGRILQAKGGRKAVVVANGRQQVAEALEAGCDAIEQGYAMGEENLREMAKRGVLWIPSLLRAKNALDSAGSGGAVCCRFSQRYVAPGKPLPGAEAFWQKTLAAHLTQLRLARKWGVTTATGTGAGSAGILHGEAMVEEMKLFIKAGYCLEEAIHCASENGARFFGMERLGTLTVGQKATFLITRGTVQQLPRKLSYLEGIYVDGAPSTAYHKNPVSPT